MNPTPTAPPFSAYQIPSSWDLGFQLARVLISLGIVCILAFVVLKFILPRMVRGTRRPGGMKVIETLRISPRGTIHAVRLPDRVLLVGATDQGLTALAELPDWPLEPHTEPAYRSSFSSFLTGNHAFGAPGVKPDEE
ncbi:flagellar biosynthetic protein FliO [bacterium]|nr:flagellar biosynthetic protein FliO [candidate division CSSED10-310 bacterium]